MYAIITAGGKPSKDDVLFDSAEGDYKVLINIAGKTLLQWALDAVNQSKSIKYVIIVGMGDIQGINCKLPITFVEPQGSLLENIEAGINKILEIDQAAKQVMLVSGDLPGIDGAMIDWMAGVIEKNSYEFYYPIIERSLMEKQFPGAERTYVRMKEGEFCGGDLIGIHTSMLKKNNLRGRKLVESRKNPLKQARILGLDMCVRLAAGKLSIDRDVPIICKRLGINGKAIVSPYAEIAMDIDKPHHLTVMEKFLTSKKEAA